MNDKDFDNPGSSQTPPPIPSNNPEILNPNVIKGGYLPPAGSTQIAPLPSFVNQPATQATEPFSAGDNKIIKRNALLAVLALVGLVVLLGSIIFSWSNLMKHLSKRAELTLAQSKTSSQPANLQSKTPDQAPPASATAPASSQASSSPVPTPAASTAKPVNYNLSNADNGRSLNLTVGDVVNVNLSALPGETSAFHWSMLLESLTNTECPTSHCLSIFKGDNYTLKPDGSISHTNLIMNSTGKTVLGYSYEPNCYPGCSQQKPLEIWQVTLLVN